MSDRHDEFREWAGAYALGALEPPERRAFEEHLDGCSSCSDEVRSLLPLHGLLSQLDPAELTDPLNDRTADVIVARAREEQRELRASRGRWRTAAVSTVAAALIAVAAVTVATSGGGPDTPTWSEGPEVAAQITASRADTTAVYTSARGWGTEIHVELVGLPPRPQYQLWVIDRDGAWTQSSTWGPTPSGGATVTGATSVATDALERIVVTSQDREEILVDASV